MFKHICRIPNLICCLLILFLFIPSFLQAECISGDCYNGTGTQTWPDGTKYVGEWRDDKYHGTGTYTWPNGQKYVGEFRDGKFNGKGTHTWPNGQKYVGEFRDDKFNGRGTLTFPNGKKYVGEFRDDKRNGTGTFTWPNGQKYVGEFRDGKRNGKGTQTWPDGQKYVGEWRDDKPVEQKTTAGGLSQPGASNLSEEERKRLDEEELKRINEALKQRYPETTEPATTTQPQNNDYILWIVFGAAFAVFIIFLIWKNKSSNQEGVHTTQQKQQVYTPNKPESSQSFICPHCDEKVQKGITKCPYCAENISGLETEDEQELIYRKIKSELQKRCQLFEVVAFLIREQSNQGGLSGKVWFEAKMKNNTKYTFKEPIVTLMTIKNNQHMQNEQSNSFPEVGTVMMSSSDDVSWKPDETILFTGKIDLLSEDVLNYELKFIDYLAKTLELVQEEPINIDNYISTRWIASPCLAVKSQFVNITQHS